LKVIDIAPAIGSELPLSRLLDHGFHDSLLAPTGDAHDIEISTLTWPLDKVRMVFQGVEALVRIIICVSVDPC
jgi:hypothetical protein